MACTPYCPGPSSKAYLQVRVAPPGRQPPVRQLASPAGHPPFGVGHACKREQVPEEMWGMVGVVGAPLILATLRSFPVTFGFGLRVQGFGLRVQGFGLRVQGFGLRAQSAGCGMQNAGLSGAIWRLGAGLVGLLGLLGGGRAAGGRRGGAPVPEEVAHKRAAAAGALLRHAVGRLEIGVPG